MEYLLIFIVLTLLVKRSVQEGFIDDTCTLFDGTSGKCQAAKTCSYVVELAKNRQFNQIMNCGFIGIEHIACCKKQIDKPCKYAVKRPLGLNDHVIDGFKAYVGEYPFTAALRDIKDRSIPVEVNVKQCIVHEEYEPPSWYNDIAIIQLEEPVKMSLYVWPAFLHKKEPLETRRLELSGFGYSKIEKKKKNGIPLNTKSDWLLKADMNEFPLDKCQEILETPKLRLELEMKAQFQMVLSINNYVHHSSKSGSCSGDSGSSLQFYANNSYRIVGIVQGKLNYNPEVPTIFTNVSSYIRWIEEKIKSLE